MPACQRNWFEVNRGGATGRAHEGVHKTTAQMKRNVTVVLFLGIVGSLAWTTAAVWKLTTELQTTTAFLQSYFFEEALKACEAVQDVPPDHFLWRKGRVRKVVGLTSFKSDHQGMIVASYTLYADGIVCQYSPTTKKASIASDGKD